jgi:hypothetical protein
MIAELNAEATRAFTQVLSLSRSLSLALSPHDASFTVGFIAVIVY